MKLISINCPSNKYSIKCPYFMNPTRIVVHNTANDASARNEITYMLGNNYQTSFHYAVDDKEIVQGIPENRNTWNASDGSRGKGNREGISIEICYSKSGGDKFIKAEENAIELIVDILKRYNWGIDRVTKHQDYTSKYCPHRTLDLGWTRFLNKIKERLGNSQINSFGYINNAFVGEWQRIMNNVYHCNLAIDNSFGPDSQRKASIVKYQPHFVLPTIKNEYVRWIQNKLIKLGYNIVADGSFGPATRDAVMQYQKSRLIEADGWVGRYTVEWLLKDNY